MNVKEWHLALALAESDQPISFREADCLSGCALADFQPIRVPLRAIAAMMRWQCLCFNGRMDYRELAELESVLVGKRSKVRVIPDSLDWNLLQPLAEEVRKTLVHHDLV